MINFPVLERLDISDYALFPGPEGSGSRGLHVAFQAGITLAIGANGLGKSTLVGIIFRLLAGPFDIPGLAGRTDLGTVRLEPSGLSHLDRTTFAQRVSDGARSARAELTFKLGSHSVIVQRRLSNLVLAGLTVDGKLLTDNEEQTYQTEIPKLVGVWSFGDWLLLLRHLVFYFEDRRALVWDPSAQRQILRSLFLPVETAGKWTREEREVLQLDSRVRNLNAALSREERALAKTEARAESSAEIHEELKTLEKLQGTDQERVERLRDEIPELEALRQRARLRALNDEQERESSFRELERARLLAISSRFPTGSETARYIMAQLLTENACLVCGHIAPEAAANYATRIDQKRCIVCGSDLSADGGWPSRTEIADARLAQLTANLAKVETELGEARRASDEAARAYNIRLKEIQEVNSRLAYRSERIDSLVRRLPPAEAQMHQQRSELATMRSRVELLRGDLNSKRRTFSAFIEDVKRELVTQSGNVKNSFEAYARGFLLETCRLLWTTRKDRLGETGELIDFPAYQVQMTGTDFALPVPRSGPEQVSESQREFIDLAFRMALVAVAGAGGTGTLIVDAPESSLDAVFVKRAVDVLLRFASATPGNRLLVTCNIIEGSLIPGLLSTAEAPADKTSRIINLFDIATPTEATRKLREQYKGAMEKILSHAGGHS